ncbi:MAG: hypothetical protein WAM60_14710, partial [Candidatus Promineifilaceae bacterium]
MKILKNQIQSTLLDVQEQVLIHYYPALRAENSEPLTDSLRPSGRQGQRDYQNGAFKSMDKTNDDPPIPVVKEVTLDEIRQRQNGNGSNYTNGNGTMNGNLNGAKPHSTPNGTSPTSHWDQFTLLTSWIEKSVHTIGVAHTQKLIEANVNEELHGNELKGT